MTHQMDQINAVLHGRLGDLTGDFTRTLDEMRRMEYDPEVRDTSGFPDRIRKSVATAEEYLRNTGVPMFICGGCMDQLQGFAPETEAFTLWDERTPREVYVDNRAAENCLSRNDPALSVDKAQCGICEKSSRGFPSALKLS